MKIYTRSILFLLLILSLSVAISPKTIAGLFNRPGFFEKGYDEFEDEIRQFERGEETSTVPLDIERQNVPWSRIISDSSKFTALLPPGTITQEADTAEDADSVIEFDIVASNRDNSRYVIAYSQALEPAKFEDSEALLETARQTIVSDKSGFKIIANDSIDFEGFPGKQFQLRSDQETFVFRLILVEDRLYVLAVNQQNDDLSEKLITQFFQSFQLLE